MDGRQGKLVERTKHRNGRMRNKVLLLQQTNVKKNLNPNTTSEDTSQLSMGVNGGMAFQSYGKPEGRPWPDVTRFAKSVITNNRQIHSEWNNAYKKSKYLTLPRSRAKGQGLCPGRQTWTSHANENRTRPINSNFAAVLLLHAAGVEGLR